MILRFVDTWQGYTRCRPFLVMLTLALLAAGVACGGDGPSQSANVTFSMG